MQLVLLHYHLNRGGVTSVIENHLRALALRHNDEPITRVAILYGGRAAAWNPKIEQELPFPCSLVPFPELEYDNLPGSGRNLYDALQAALASFDRELTIIHVHNHSLGKNAAIASALGRLAEENWRLLLQIHDFAEDLRPANYQHLLSRAESPEQLQSELYPQATQIHYAVLNSRDHKILTDAQIAIDRLHLLPNPVQQPHDQAEPQEIKASRAKLTQTLELPLEHKFVLYPVRAIRRKNLGELLLWSMLVEEATFAVTLAPLNPQEQTIYNRWVQFAESLQLPAQFDIASKSALSFEATYAAADAIITTSVAEGFGMVYLEAALAGRPLVGRNLPSVCNDFLTAGMKFPGLADTMSIPADCVDLTALKRTYLELTQQLRAAYQLEPADPAELSALIDNLFSGNTIDFGRLESSSQQEFLRRLHSDAELRSAVCQLNPTLQTLTTIDEQALQSNLQHNCQVIDQHYSLAVIGDRLRHVYQTVLASNCEPVTCQPDPARSVLASFMHPSQLYPLRLES